MAGNHTGSSLSPMSYWPACPLPFLKACTWVRHFFLSKFTSSICIQWICVGFFMVVIGYMFMMAYINNMKSIFSIYSLPFYKVHERLTETMKHVSGVKAFDTRTFSLFFYPFMSFFVSDSLWYFVTINLSAYWIFFYALLSNRYFFNLSFMKFFKSLYVIVEILDHQFYNSITEC